MPSNYDNSAWFYDRLSRMVYGQAPIKAQTQFLYHIPPGSKILIAGGGSGRIIEDVAKQHPAGLHITYVEISQKMMALSRERDHANNFIQYINAPVEDAGLKAGFDVMITPFLLDNFTKENFDKVFNCLHHLLISGGLWLNTDFQLTGKWWQFILLKTMYPFFKLSGGMEASSLPKIKPAFEKNYKLIDEKTFFGDFMITGVYMRGQ